MKKSYLKNPAFVFITLICLMGVYDAEAATSFPEQFIHSGTGGYFPDGHFERDSEALNLEGVFYKSDGKTLEARLVTHGTTGFSANNTLSYGMLIDSDSDFDTGRNGFDHRYYIQWENGIWYEIYEELPTGSVNTKEIYKSKIEQAFFPESVILDDQLKHTVELSLDLEKIDSPELFAIVFFSEGHFLGDMPLRQDVLSLAVIPPPEFVVRTNPPLISFESSTEKVVHILVESDIAETSDVHYNVYSDSNNAKATKLIGNTVSMKGGMVEIPILLHDQGHDDTQIHKLFVELNPWYDVNPDTSNAERGGEIFDSYHFRNQQTVESFTIFWSSLPAPPYNWQLPVQIAILIATGVMVVFAFFTYRKNAEIATYDSDEKHKHQILSVYDRMQYLIPRYNGITKEISIEYPEEHHRSRVEFGKVAWYTTTNVDTLKLNETKVLFYNAALKHLKKYPETHAKWKSLYESVSDYNKEVDLIKQEIQKLCLKFIQENLSDFKDAKNDNEHVFYIDTIVYKAYEILDDVVNNRQVDFSLEYDGHKISDMYPELEIDGDDDEMEHNASKNGSGFFRSSKHIPAEADNLLGSVMTQELQEKFKSLKDKENPCYDKFDELRSSIKEVVRELNLGMKLKGECDFELESSFKITSIFNNLKRIFHL